MDEIPQRPGAAMGFRALDSHDEGESTFLSDSAVIADDAKSGSDMRSLGRNHSITGILEESMTGRNAGDLISEADELISEGAGDAGADADSIDSILDDDEGDSQDRSGMSTLTNRDRLATPVPLLPKDEREGRPGKLPELDEKGVADALAAVAGLAETSLFQDLGTEIEAQHTHANGEYSQLY
jgi:hypothetical protein